jgi:predicted RNA-binding Zn ribbon-like protein
VDGDWRLRCETGATWLDLVATVSKAYGPAPVERLVDARGLRAWFADEGLPPEQAPGQDDLARTHGLREALRGLALAVVRSEPLPARHIGLVNDVLADDVPLQLRASAVRPPATVRQALARIARQAVEHLFGPAAATLHQCADAECGMLFLDPAGRRRWCAAEVCGVRHRVRAHRRRRTAGAG